MGRLWCRDLRLVTVPHGDMPKPVTFVYPYFENPQFFGRQLANWFGYPADLREHLSVIVVDDGSPEHPAADVARGWNIGCPLRLFRIGVDIRWNWLAARNIGAHHASDGWLLLTDMDHVVNDTTLRALIYGQHDPALVYGFQRADVKHNEVTPATPHSASFFLTRARFWKTGGYDETLSGHYGTDGEFRRRLLKTGPMVISDDMLLRYEYDGDSSTTRYLRKQPEDAAVARLVAARKPGWQPKTLSFPYTEVSAC